MITVKHIRKSEIPNKQKTKFPKLCDLKILLKCMKNWKRKFNWRMKKEKDNIKGVVVGEIKLEQT